MNQNQTESKPADAEQENGKELDGAPCSALLSMDTAPKDGSEILILWRKERIVAHICYWWIEEGEYPDFDPCWRYLDENEFEFIPDDESMTPLGWMPLPSLLNETNPSVGANGKDNE